MRFAQPGPAYLLGSSGAISGAIGACLVFCPRAHVKVLYWFFFTGGTALLGITQPTLLRRKTELTRHS